MKLINDTLKGPRGKWSRKSLTAVTSFLLAIITGLYIVFTMTVNAYAISVFFGFLGLGGGTLALTVIDKVKQNRNDENSN